ncbi:bH1641 protein [Coprobacillus sp. CAG:698]|nr:bH1641 protein [Coprobacillus sp. CAG:698]
MNLGKVLNLITENNINPEDVFKLVDKVKTMDLKNEDNIRDVIHEVSKIDNKPIDAEKENALVKKILSDGLNEDLINMI